MAKVSFSKLKCKINEEIKTIDFAGEKIEVKQYLPIQEKLELIGKVVEFAHEEDYNFSNPVKAEVFRNLEILFAYTNISFTEKQKEDLPKLYDSVFSSGLLQAVLEAIPEQERNSVECGVWNSISAIYEYQHSVLGILDTMQTDYSNLDFNVQDLVNKIKDPESLDIVKGLLTNLN